MADPTPVAAPDTAAGQVSQIDAPQPQAEVQPGAGPRQETSLSPDVHPAVRQERERNARLRSLLTDAYVLDDQGQPVGVRSDFAERVAAQLRASAPPQETPADANARLEQVVTKFAETYGMLPDQVRGIISLVDHVAQQRAREYGAPMVESALDQMRSSLISSGDVPREAAPYVEKWFNEAKAANPRATMTAAGRDTILRQALGDYALTLLRARRGGAPAPATGSPALLRPTPGMQNTPVSDEERQIRTKLGLPGDYTDATRKIEGGF